MQDSISQYAEYQFAQSVETVLNQKGGVMEQLSEIKTVAVEGRDISVQNRKDAHFEKEGQAKGKAISKDEDSKPIFVEPESLLTDEQKNGNCNT